MKTYIQFVLALAAKALRAKTTSSKRREFNVATTEYDWRVFLVSHLGLIGDEFKTARHHLTKHLPAPRPGRASAAIGAPVTSPSPRPRRRPLGRLSFLVRDATVIG